MDRSAYYTGIHREIMVEIDTAETEELMKTALKCIVNYLYFHPESRIDTIKMVTTVMVMLTEDMLPL